MDGLRDVTVLDAVGNRLSEGLGVTDNPTRILESSDVHNSALSRYIGSALGTKTTLGEVASKAEELQLVSRRNQPKGYWVVLPAGMLLERAVNSLNERYARSINAHSIEFPGVFDTKRPATAALIAPYERQGRLSYLAEPDGDLALAYAADPMMFTWLQDRIVAAKSLPYAMYSPMNVQRRFPSGELSIQRMRQFAVPDMHVLADSTTYRDAYLACVRAAARGTSHLFGDDWLHVVDIESPGPLDDTNLIDAIATATGNITVIRPVFGHLFSA